MAAPEPGPFVPDPHPALNERLELLERAVGELARELRALRTAVDRIEAGRDRSPPEPREVKRATTPVAFEERAAEPVPEPVAAAVEPPPAVPPIISRPRPAPPPAERRSGVGRRSMDFESLIGRYGTLALASLTILMGAGAFLRWAIANGKIGPELRVMLGAIGAGAIAAVGWRLRARGSMRFGSTLIALALALVHVDAWGAGPYLQLVPSWVALSIAATASIAVAALAWFGEEETLFSVGVGGALIAPFVTSRSSGSAVLLLAYGFVVLASGLAALRGRAWRTALVVTTLGCWLYTAVATEATSHGVQARMKDAPALFALAIAWTALVVTRGAWGARIARSALSALFGTLAVVATSQSTGGGDLLVFNAAIDVLVLAAVGTLTAYAAVHVALRDGGGGEGVLARRSLFTAAVLPLALGAVAVEAAADTATARALVAIGWTAAAVAAAYAQPAVRATHLMVAGIASAAAILLALENITVKASVALAAHAAALALLLRRERTKLLGVPIAVSLTIATMWAFTLLSRRSQFEYTPFLTSASLAAAAVAAAWLVVSWNASRVELADGGTGTVETRTAIRLAGAVVTFMWGNEELSRAYSRDTSTFLLILYYASVGVAAIFVGRARGIRVLRHVGLGLAIFAALKAIAEASSLAIGVRVGSYLLAGLFLLAVAYWYRERSGEPGGTESDSNPANRV
jgi:hypothetical protein